MTIKWKITVVVSVMLAIFTPIGLFTYVIPFLIGCIGGSKVWKFYFKFFFGNEW
jgi:hypothetical protein